MLNPVLIQEAREQARSTRRNMMEVLEERLGAPEIDEFVCTIAATWRCRPFGMDDLHAHTPDFNCITYAESAHRECVFVRHESGPSFLVVANPFDADFTAWVEARIPHYVEWGVAHRRDISAYLALHEDSMRAMDGLLQDELDIAGRDKSGIEDLSILSISNDASAVVRLVHSTLYDALKSGASDIHLETDADRLLIKYRMDGVLSTVGTVAGIALAEQIISRIKVMSELDIAERRIPQDGRFKVSLRGREIDFRVSIMPSIFGEDAVLRILDRSTITQHVQGMRLEDLGFDAATVARFRKMALEPYGMALVTGPTGSGKTTTLYAAISEVNNGQDKIITIEDPVEYRLAGVLQIPVNEKKGLTFARGLRSILRHDPDKIMVGEIRDPETAQIAIQSALTGHLVFTTVHANNVFDVISRFIHMNIDPFSLVSALNGVMSQRLVRVICPHCAVAELPARQLLEDSRIPEHIEDYVFRVGRGCGNCRGTGYKGRKAIAEILDLNDELRELIVSKAPIREIKEAARQNGTRFLREAALDLVRQGVTTLQEVNRVTFVD